MNKHNQHRPSDLDKVLTGEPAHEADRLREVWALAGSEEATEFPKLEAIERVWQTLETVAASHEEPNPRPRLERTSRRRRARLRPWMAVAATFLIGAIGLALWLQPVTRTAPLGQRMAVLLPDGSQVELNSGTTLHYARRFGQQRVVHLEGEAFFDVVNEDRPFIIHTFNAQVAVLGTRFNVRAWRRSMDPGTTVTLAEGRVALAPSERPEQAVELEPGQTHRIAREPRQAGPPDSAAVGVATAWRNGDLDFRDQWLGVILEDIERRFAVALTVTPQTLARKQMTLVWRNPVRVEAVIRDLCVALKLNYRETSNGYEIYTDTP